MVELSRQQGGSGRGSGRRLLLPAGLPLSPPLSRCLLPPTCCCLIHLDNNLISILSLEYTVTIAPSHHMLAAAKLPFKFTPFISVRLLAAQLLQLSSCLCRPCACPSEASTTGRHPRAGPSHKAEHHSPHYHLCTPSPLHTITTTTHHHLPPSPIS